MRYDPDDFLQDSSLFEDDVYDMLRPVEDECGYHDLYEDEDDYEDTCGYREDIDDPDGIGYIDDRDPDEDDRDPDEEFDMDDMRDEFYEGEDWPEEIMDYGYEDF